MKQFMKLIYYTAPWCQPCKTFRPQAEREAAERGLHISFVDVDANSELATYDNILSLPTVLAIDVGTQLEIDRVVGASLPTLKRTLDKLGEKGYNGQLVTGVN